jgi:hypothetical protein
MSGYEVDLVGLAAQAPQYEVVAAQVGAICDTLRARLEAEGECWGGDAPGVVFGTKYAGPASSALAQLDATNQGLISMLHGVRMWAANYAGVDALVREHIAAIVEPD